MVKGNGASAKFGNIYTHAPKSMISIILHTYNHFTNCM